MFLEGLATYMRFFFSRRPARGTLRALTILAATSIVAASLDAAPSVVARGPAAGPDLLHQLDEAAREASSAPAASPAPAPLPAAEALVNSTHAVSRRAMRARHERHRRRTHNIIRHMVRSGPVHTGAQTPLARAGALPRTSQADAEIGGGLGAATTSEAQAAAEAQVETSACAALTLEEMSTF